MMRLEDSKGKRGWLGLVGVEKRERLEGFFREGSERKEKKRTNGLVS